MDEQEVEFEKVQTEKGFKERVLVMKKRLFCFAKYRTTQKAAKLTGLNGENFINVHRRLTKHQKGIIKNGVFHFKRAGEPAIADIDNRVEKHLEENKEIKGDGF